MIVSQSWKEAKPLLEMALIGSDSNIDEIESMISQELVLFLESERAFVVLEPVEFDGGVDLFIWAAASRGPTDCISKHLPEIEEYGRAIGARYVAFRSSRKGFERILPNDWKLKQVTWAKEL